MPSRYSLVIAVAKRAKQLREGASKLVESKSKNPITIALEEIAAGEVKVVIPTQEEINAASRRQELVPERPKLRETAELLRVPGAYESEEEEGEGSLEDLSEEETELGNQSAELGKLSDEDTDDEIRPLDEVEGIPGESALGTLESEE